MKIGNPYNKPLCQTDFPLILSSELNMQVLKHREI